MFSKCIVALYLSYALCAAASGQPASKTADDEFTDLQVASRPLPVRPPAANGRKTVQENKEDQERQASVYVLAASKAKDFYTKFPAHARAAEAKKIECTSLLRAVQSGVTTEEPRAIRMGHEFRADKRNPSADRLEVATLMAQMDAGKKGLRDRKAMAEEHERQAMNLLGEFSNEPGIYDYFLGAARIAEPDRARALLQRVLLSPATTAQKTQAQTMVDRLNMPGSSPAFEWQDDKGVSRRISDYKGKIVVFYVWSELHPGVAASAQVVASHIKGPVELIAVNIDNDVTKAKDGGRRNATAQSNYYDSRGHESPLALQLKIDRVPGVHVVDSKGVYIGRGTPSELASLLTLAAK